MGEAGMLSTNEPVFLGQRLVAYRPDPGKLNKRFLLYAFQSEDVQMQIRSLASGSTVQHMRVPDSKALEITLPALSEQERIADQLDSLREHTRYLESLYRRKLALVEALKKSLLNQALTGQL
jgi:type I restriction enzyme, S subunit